MINPLSCYEDLYALMSDHGLGQWSNCLRSQLETAFDVNKHGHLDDWLLTLVQLPDISASVINLDKDTVTIGQASDASADDQAKLKQLLNVFHPWRKGPFNLFGINIDTEWRSDWKWQRLQGHIENLEGRSVLDIGCGSGYHCWRMSGANAKFVLGIDPFIVFNMQYQAMRKYIPEPKVYVLPLGIEAVPQKLEVFDTVFSMGILYHRKLPQTHLSEIFSCLRSGGELVLETLVIDGGAADVLIPDGRYAKMRNVSAIPSCLLLESWLEVGGFTQIKLVDVSDTTTQEQRSTQWMRFESLANFLDPEDASKTIEGYPAPKRAVFTAKKP